ncbi:Phosphatase dcr2 [Tilletia horrida]|nr:Phosphatase dcr2 [Tilletia horrida]
MWPLRSRNNRSAALRLHDDGEEEERAADIIAADMRQYPRSASAHRHRHSLPIRAAQRVVSSNSRIASMALFLTLAFTMFILFALRHDRITFEDRLIGWQQYLPISTRPLQALQQQQQQAELQANSTAVTFPLDLYLPLMPNTAPLTDITVRKCVALLPCIPPTTPDLDAQLGKWVRVERYLDSSAAIGTSSLSWLSSFFRIEETYIYYRRSRLPHVPRVVDVRVLEAGQELPSHLPDDGASGWKIVETDLRQKFLKSWGGLPGAKLVYRIAEAGAVSKLEPITEIEIVYGPNPPWPGFTEVGAILPPNLKDGTESVTLTMRRSPQPAPQLPQPLRFQPNGHFKIMQIADLHLSVAHETCRDTDKNPCVGDTDSIALVSKWLDEEKPDLVVLSGDQLNGQGTSWDVKSVLPKVTKMLVDRKILFAAIQGNHDSETDKLTRKQQQTLLSLLPYSLTRVGPSSIHGTSNYDIKLHSPTPDASHIFTLYFLDSGDYPPEASSSSSKGGSLFGSVFGGGGKKKPTMKGKLSHYDWVRRDQIDWFLDLSAHVKKMLRPYVPDGAADLPKQPWAATRARGQNGSERRRGRGARHGRRGAEAHEDVSAAEVLEDESRRRRRRGGSLRTEQDVNLDERSADEPQSQSADADADADADHLDRIPTALPDPRQGRTLSKPPALMFMHIPVPEAYETELVDVEVGSGKKIILSGEPESSGGGGGGGGGDGRKGGLLEADTKGGQGDRGIFDAILKQSEEDRDVKAIGFGHNHLNEACRRTKGIWLCFNGGSSYAGYGKPTFPRRVRIFELSDYGNVISTYHRLEGGENAGRRVGEGVLFRA